MAMEEAAVVRWPGEGVLTEEWLDAFTSTLERATRELTPSQLGSLLPVPVIDSLVASASKLLHREPNCLQVCVESSSSVVLVGDLHGQLHDLLHLLQLAGPPSLSRIFVFNGDYVDRGAWGLETVLLLLAWKIFLPHRVFLLRGNHETRFCTAAYGFEQEVMVKYGEHGKHIYRRLLGCFEGLPLAAIVADCVFMAHGGLFRHVETTQKKENKKGRGRRPAGKVEHGVLQLGTLGELALARRGILDPPEKGNNVLVSDILWSDPAPNHGLHPNPARGIGLLWGPDCTEEFLQKHKLKLIVRSHEGPDARVKRHDMIDMNKGYTIDHVVNSGMLITLFSAPDYPQFQVFGLFLFGSLVYSSFDSRVFSKGNCLCSYCNLSCICLWLKASNCRYNNKGAYILLEAPDFSSPNFFSFTAALPRPKATAYYDFVNAVDSDEEIDLGASSDGSTDMNR